MLWVIKSTATGTFQQFPTPTAHKRLHPPKLCTPTQERDRHPGFNPTFLKGCMKYEETKMLFSHFFSFFCKSGSISTCLAENENAPEKWRQTMDTLLNFKLTFVKTSAKLGHRCLLFYLNGT